MGINGSARIGIRFYKLFSCHVQRGKYNFALMLLSVGADPELPEGKTIPSVMKPQIQSWIEQIDTAKPCLEALFDDEMLEQLLMGFVFNEAFLRKALENCD